ncbi:putative tricarboxylic transport membrane protein [Caldalkalibacillus uzonensis]|uniref:Tricarboxylic transport membrane protein n=1 Tax=Caldalkalibacillus uzonensis TaxID=353224 RepID=A0ABU0CNV0_9BACI|nr:tripartite tricarboxylate transporter permease [Caldalkalibacillus uzonensis]MDQ0338092.1 putative tricarboxylic transport membrane protein [Caldalkalibacillus uzonensis]
MLGLSVVLTPTNLFFLMVGAFVGMVVGIIPGFGPTAGIAILLSLTFTLDPTTAIIMLAGIYYGSMYGGTITSILINTPGESATVASTFDGYPLAQKGRVGPALVMQAFASFIGGTIGVILISAFAPVFSKIARSFGPPEYFMLMLFGLCTLVLMMGERKRYGVISALVGLAIAMVGVDVVSGVPRFTFGSPELMNGIYFLPVAIGVFGIGEALYSIYKGTHKELEKEMIKVNFRGSQFWPAATDWIQSKFTFVRGSIIGFFTGVLPGAGATIASLLSYSFEKKVSKQPQEFGKGHMPGLVAPETANNAASSGAMIPLLTLGIPGSGATAVLLGAFLMWGLRPGPLLMSENPEFAWGLISSMYLGNVILLVVNIVAIPLFIKVMQVPYRLLVPVIIVLCAVGTFSLHGSIIETWILLIFGLVGFFMKMYGYSPAALVLALVLGSMAEETLRQSLIISGGSLSIFLTRPVSLLLFIFVCLLVFSPLFIKITQRNKKKHNPQDFVQ